MIRKSTAILTVIASLFLLAGCEEDESSSVQLPLAGTYELTDFHVRVVGVSNIDTTVGFVTPVNGATGTEISVNTTISDITTHYSNADISPTYGTITLDNEGYATLEGALPTNIGTKCNPLIQITALGPVVGEWEADTSNNAFSIEMVIEQLDIDGYYTLDTATNRLTVFYTVADPSDTLGIYSIIYGDTAAIISRTCWPATTTTERTMELLIQE